MTINKTKVLPLWANTVTELATKLETELKQVSNVTSTSISLIQPHDMTKFAMIAVIHYTETIVG